MKQLPSPIFAPLFSENRGSGLSTTTRPTISTYDTPSGNIDPTRSRRDNSPQLHANAKHSRIDRNTNSSLVDYVATIFFDLDLRRDEPLDDQKFQIPQHSSASTLTYNSSSYISTIVSDIISKSPVLQKLRLSISLVDCEKIRHASSDVDSVNRLRPSSTSHPLQNDRVKDLYTNSVSGFSSWWNLQYLPLPYHASTTFLIPLSLFLLAKLFCRTCDDLLEFMVHV